MTSDKPTPFDQHLQQLESEFVRSEQLGESDEDIARALLEFILKRERLRLGVDGDELLAQKVDNQTLTKMSEWDSDDPMLSTVEKVFRKIATGQGTSAVLLLKAAVNAKIQAISDEQRRKAQTPKRANPVNVLIEQMVTRNQTISVKELLRALHGQIGQGVIDDIDDDYITPADGKFEEIKVDGLKDRLTRIKKKIAKAG
jgi:hypothetical protein